MMRVVQRGVVALLAVWPVAASKSCVDYEDHDVRCPQHERCVLENYWRQAQNQVRRRNNTYDNDSCGACFFQFDVAGNGGGDCLCGGEEYSNDGNQREAFWDLVETETFWDPVQNTCVLREETLTIPSRGALQYHLYEYCTAGYARLASNEPLFLTGSGLPPPEQWDISAVTDLSFLWPWLLPYHEQHCYRPLSGVGSWDVSRVTRMKGTLRRWQPWREETLDLSKWDVRKVTDMSKIFEDLGNYTFHDQYFLHPEQIKGLEMWKPINVMNFNEMLKGTSGFHTFLQMWAKVMPLDAQYVWAFENSDYPMTARDKTAFSTQPWVKDITKYDVPKGKLKKMINSWCNSTSDCKDWGCVHLKYWKLHEDETSMEYAAAGLTECNRSLVGMRYWDVGKITDMTALFNGNTVLQDMDLGGWDVRKVTTMFQMFRGAKGFTGRGLAQWDPSSVVKAKAMFKKVFTLDQGFIPDFKDRMSRDVETGNWLDRASTMSAGSAGSNVEIITPGSAPRASAFAASLLAIVTTSFAVTV